MQSTAFDNELRNFSFGLDTPTNYLNSSSPAPWSLSGGLTPSLFASLNGERGFTPGIGGAHASTSEPNPFELSLSGGSASKRHSIAEGRETTEEKNGNAQNEFDFLSSSTLMGGRKRASSTPVCTPGGTNFNFLQHQAPAGIANDFAASFALPPSKRPRMGSMASSSNNSSADKVFSDVEKSNNDGEGSPASSTVLTPPESNAFLHPLKPIPHLAVDTQVSAAPSALQPHPLAHAPLNASPLGAAHPANLFSQLDQQRNHLVATGNVSYSQAAPLPLHRLDASIVVKPEPRDEFAPSLVIAARPPVTRGVSTRRSAAQAIASSSAAKKSESPVPPPMKRKGGRKKGAAAAAKARKEAGEDDGGENAILEGDDEETIKRKQFLERNRVAACKSRQKKKEKVGQLEQLAGHLCQRNHVLQQQALALRQEALQLRQLMLAHNGCNCEHAQGYIVRDAKGGGIATIDQLAGRTLTMDYSQPPAMGTDDDVYSFLDRSEPAPPLITEVDPLDAVSTGYMRESFIPVSTPVSAVIPIKVAGPPAPGVMHGSPTLSDVDGVRTRSASRPQHLQLRGGTRQAPPSFVPGVPSMGMDMHMSGPPTQGFDINVHSRANSAPPITPSWEAPGAQPRAEYF